MSDDLIPVETALADHANAIRALGKRVVGDVIEIGRRLIICKEKCGHGNWMPWVEREFGWSMSTANKYMNIARMFDHKLGGKFVGNTNLTIDIEALKTLAEPRTPEEARAEIIGRAEAGDHLSVADVQRTVAKAKQRTKPPSLRSSTNTPEVKTAEVPRADNFAPPDTRRPTDPTKYDEVRAARARLDQLHVVLRAFDALKNLGTPAQIAEAVKRLDVNSRDTLHGLWGIHLFTWNVFAHGHDTDDDEVDDDDDDDVHREIDDV